MTDSVKDWRKLNPRARAILVAAADIWYGGDVDLAYKVALERDSHVIELPRPRESTSQVQLRVGGRRNSP